MTRIVAAALALPALASPAFAQTSLWNIDTAHSSAQFGVRHLMVSTVRGELGKVTGTLTFDEKDPPRSSVEVTIDVATLDTREAKRDEHLRSPEFFDVAQYPTATFKSKKVKKAAKGKLEVMGDLTLRGVTREVVLKVDGPTAVVKDPWGNHKRGVSATATINRRHFGLDWNVALESGGVLVGEEVAISIELQLVRKPVEAKARD